MADLLKRLVELEADVRYQELPSSSEPEIRYIPGEIPILLSAPHGASHTRSGGYKQEDEFTASFARLVSERTGAHVIYTRRRSGTCTWGRLRPAAPRPGGPSSGVVWLVNARPCRAFTVPLTRETRFLPAANGGSSSGILLNR